MPGMMEEQASGGIPRGETEVALEEQEAAGQGADPITGAFTTLQSFIAAMGERGDPKAQQLNELLKQMVGLLLEGGGEEQEMMEQPQQGQPEAAPAPRGNRMAPQNAGNNSVQVL